MIKTFVWAAVYLLPLAALAELPSIGRSESRAFTEKNPSARNLLADHLLRAREGAGTRGGGNGAIFDTSAKIFTVNEDYRHLADTIARFDYESIENATLKRAYIEALRSGFAARASSAPLLVLDLCQGERGPLPVVYEIETNGSICLSARETETFFRLRGSDELTELFLRIRLSQFMGLDLGAEEKEALHAWMKTSDFPLGPTTDASALRAEYNLAIPTPDERIPSDWICGEPTSFGTIRTAPGDLGSDSHDLRKDLQGAFLTRTKSGFAKCHATRLR